MSYYENDDFDKAIADCTEAIRLNPTLAQAYSMRASAYRAIGDESKASEDERKFKELGK